MEFSSRGRRPSKLSGYLNPIKYKNIVFFSIIYKLLPVHVLLNKTQTMYYYYYTFGRVNLTHTRIMCNIIFVYLFGPSIT